MPVKKVVAPAKVYCDNHPQREAAHTTNTPLHSAISLCRVCLRRAPHLAER